MTNETTVATRLSELSEELPLVMIAGNAEMELRKAALRAGTSKTLKTGKRAFQKGTADPEYLPCSIVESPRGPFAVFDAGSYWGRHIQPDTLARYLPEIAGVCQRTDGLLIDRIDDEPTTRSIARMAAAYGVPRAAVWVERLPEIPGPDERGREAKALAKESFSRAKVFEGDLKAVAGCQCGDDDCETCGPWLELVDYATQARRVRSVGAFRLLTTDVTGWGIEPGRRIARGSQTGSMEVGDTVQVHTESETYEAEIEEIARGGLVFTILGPSNKDIVALAKPGSLELRKSAAVREYGDPRAGSGDGYVEGVAAGRVSVRSDASKSLLRFRRAAGFRSGDVVSVFFTHDRTDELQADSYVIRTL